MVFYNQSAFYPSVLMHFASQIHSNECCDVHHCYRSCVTCVYPIIMIFCPEFTEGKSSSEHDLWNPPLLWKLLTAYIYNIPFAVLYFQAKMKFMATPWLKNTSCMHDKWFKSTFGDIL